jgi:FtsH-binding integral membrane protein
VRTIWGVLGIALVLTGVVWIFQGAGMLKGSFMTGSGFWLGMGILAVVAGLPLAVLGFRRSRSDSERSPKA